MGNCYSSTISRQEIVPLLTERRRQRDGIAAEAERWEGIPEDLKEAKARTMEELIAKMHARWGDWERYAAAVGIADDVGERLRDSLLEG